MDKVSKEQIAHWKKEHGDIFQFTVEGKVCILKKPSRKALSYASSVGAKDPLKFNEIILKDCWVGGDEEILSNDGLFMSVIPHVATLIEIKEGELVKL